MRRTQDKHFHDRAAASAAIGLATKGPKQLTTCSWLPFLTLGTLGLADEMPVLITVLTL